MKQRRFVQCDVFTPFPTKGNGLAVIIDGAGLSDSQLQQFAAWTNLAETTFLLPPADSLADYRVRIFTPSREMLFAGHPTLGSCAAWLHIVDVADLAFLSPCVMRNLKRFGDYDTRYKTEPIPENKGLPF